MTFIEPEDATPLDPDEWQGLKFPHITTRGELDELEQANIEQGLAWVPRRRRRPRKKKGCTRFYRDNTGGPEQAASSREG